jgi:predicted metal-dependent phosphoesterase TrpH
MKIRNPYTYPHNWLKGNLHTHTTRSDGKGSIDAVLAMYRDDNYDFLSITDHRKFWLPDVERLGRMLLVPGQECHVTDGNQATDAHVVSIGASGQIEDRPDMQEIIDAVNAAGGIALVAHPCWTYMPPEDLAGVTGFAAFEVWNGGCSDVHRADSSDYWDWLMTRFKRPAWGVGTDDMHKPDHDFGLGWTWVNAQSNVASILDAIRRGDCYASSGPRIETVKVDNGSIVLHTSSAKVVKFMKNDGAVARWVEGKNVKRAEYTPDGSETYVRAEVHGHDGTVAWSNPFFIDPD